MNWMSTDQYTAENPIHEVTLEEFLARPVERQHGKYSLTGKRIQSVEPQKRAGMYCITHYDGTEVGADKDSIIKVSDYTLDERIVRSKRREASVEAQLNICRMEIPVLERRLKEQAEFTAQLEAQRELQKGQG